MFRLGRHQRPSLRIYASMCSDQRSASVEERFEMLSDAFRLQGVGLDSAQSPLCGWDEDRAESIHRGEQVAGRVSRSRLPHRNFDNGQAP